MGCLSLFLVVILSRNEVNPLQRRIRKIYEKVGNQEPTISNSDSKVTTLRMSNTSVDNGGSICRISICENVPVEIFPKVIIEPAIDLVKQILPLKTTHDAFVEFAHKDFNEDFYQEAIYGSFVLKLIRMRAELGFYSCTYMNEPNAIHFNPMLMLSMIRRLNELNSDTAADIESDEQPPVVNQPTKSHKRKGTFFLKRFVYIN